MGPRYMKDGEDFSFDKNFGFSGSAEGRHDPKSREHPDDNEYGDGSYLGKARGGHVQKHAMGGPQMPPAAGGAPGAEPQMQPGKSAHGQPMIKMTPQAAQNLVKGAGVLGAMALTRMQKAKQAQAMGGAMPPAAAGAAPPAAMAPAAAPALGPGGPAGMKKGGFIKKAIRHPGRMKKLAARHGVSTHEEMEHDKHSSDPSLRSAANLGLRLTGGDLSPRKKK